MKKPIKKAPIAPPKPWDPPGPIDCVHKYVKGVCVHCGAKKPKKGA